MIIAVVGAGGKTSYIKEQARRYVEEGKKVFVTTSTHMFAEKDSMLTDDADSIIKKLVEDGYVMAGLSDGKKIKYLPEDTYEKVCQYADVVLIEADGSKHLPLKFPRDNEPIIYENVDQIVVVYGLHSIGKKASETVHRLELAKKQMDILDETVITEDVIKEIVEKGYLIPLKRKYPDKKITVYPSEAGFLWEEKQKSKIGCVIMASGLSKRFGSNKLLVEFEGKRLIEHVLDLTEGIFHRRVVLTKTKEVETICKERNIPVIYHDLPARNDVVRLGMEQMEGMDGCLFCPCDQPLLKKESILNITKAFTQQKSGIFRLASGQKIGTPMLFGKEYFEELKNLPEKKGGSYVASKYPEQVKFVEAKEALRHIVGVQFRNTATVGGSLYPRFGFSDVLTIFGALDAYVELYGGGLVPIRKFVEDNPAQDILVRIIVKKDKRAVSYQSHRMTETDFAVLTCAVAKKEDNYSVVFGARPQKAKIVDDIQLPASYTEEELSACIENVVNQVSFGSNMRGSGQYRKAMAKVLMRRAFEELNA